ncbi:helix-turn-helix domain-containing protein [Nonomuraea sp. NPDC050153]|uniref:helix-turn-helix domain-containing protein n=1 Tax=Nonomuraea sp. NPDC050153 TaxID=3364359 RepID=UPI00379A3CF5
MNREVGEGPVGVAKKAGPAGAHAELIARLRAAMTGNGMRQADLAKKAGISTGAVSTILNGKSVPTVATLDLLAVALRLTGDALQELHRLRDTADARVRRLDDYLHAALRAAREHPYQAVLTTSADVDGENDDLPPLATVYVRQRVQGLSAQQSPREGDEAPPTVAVGPVPAEEALAGEHTCVITAGPGGGKSSLLHMRLAHGVEQWIDGRGGENVPVLVPAAALPDRSLPEALADAVKAELAAYGLSQLPAEVFATAPHVGTRWLVLVDGLDEILDVEARRRVLRMLAAIADGPHADLYRFVVASRPLPQSELHLLGSRVPHYDLQPFEAAEVETVACGWFRALGLPEPEPAAQRFVHDLRSTRLSELARIPLMMSMLCQLHAARPEQPLPASRGDIFGEFISLLRERQYPVRPQQIGAHRLTGLERYNSPAVHARAELVLARLDDLIAHLAAERHNGDTRQAIDIIEAHPDVQRPVPVAAHHWRAFVMMCLRRSGLLILRAGELTFLHQTVLEYLAARHATRDRKATAHALRTLFHRPARYPWHGRYEAPGVRPRVWLWRYWQPPPSEESSFAGFLLDLAQQQSPATALPRMSRLASARAGISGCQFIAGQAELGTTLPAPVVQAAIDLCAQWAFHPTLLRDRVPAAHVLARLGDHRGADLCATLVRTTEPTATGERSTAAAVLAELGDPRAAELCATLAADSNVRVHDRMDALATLVRLGDQRSIDIYAQMAREPKLTKTHRHRRRVHTMTRHAYRTVTRTYRYLDQATDLIMRVKDPRAIDVFLTLAADSSLPSSSRLRAADALANAGDPRAAEIYRTLAADPRLGEERLTAAKTLADAGDPDAAATYAAVAADPDVYTSRRLRAAEALAGLGDPRAADAYANLASDLAADHSYLGEIAQALVDLGDPRAGDVYIARACAPTPDSHHRLEAAHVVARLADPRAADLYAGLATDATLGGGYHPLAAQALAQLGDPRGAELLAKMITNPELHGESRAGAATALAELGDARAGDLCAMLATDTMTNGGHRVTAAKALIALQDPRAAELLAMLASETAVDARNRVTAAKELAETGDPRGTNVCAALAADTTLRDWDRVNAAKALADQGDARAVELCAALAADTTCDRWTRQRAVKIADDLGRRKAVHPLRRLWLLGWRQA